MMFVPHLDGFEHALSVVVGPQVLGDVEADGADAGDQVKHHGHNLGERVYCLCNHFYISNPNALLYNVMVMPIKLLLNFEREREREKEREKGTERKQRMIRRAKKERRQERHV